jgi:hypothetical protein
MPDFALWLAAVLLAFTSVGLLLSRDWRWSLGLLAAQYFAAFWLALNYWSLTMAAAMLVAGWMAVAVLGMTQLDVKSDPVSETSWPEGRLFRVFAAGLVLLTVTSAAQPVNAWLPNASLPLVWGGLILIGMGLLQLGLTVHPLRVTLGLLITLTGFEILYASLENSILVAALLSVVTLGLALTGSYLLFLNINAREATETPAE